MQNGRGRMKNLLSLPIGTMLVGDYRIEQVLGAGGFGVTYLARELAVDRLVTIKEYFPSDFAARGDNYVAMPRSQASSEDYGWGLERFIDEAKTLGRFNHPNIVRLYRYFHEHETAYMVLHFEEGQSLKAWLRSLGRAPRQKELDDLVAPLLDALEVIHRADFLHRDIAPDNIIMREDRTPVLIDFGSARGDIAAHTRTISALIKPGYSPYEQYAETGKKQGPWTDIYAFAATLHYAVTGKRPPDAPSRLIKDELQPSEHAAVGAFRKKFLNAIDQGLKIDIPSRPQSIAAWREELFSPDEKNTFGFAKPARTGITKPHDPSNDKSVQLPKGAKSEDMPAPFGSGIVSARKSAQNPKAASVEVDDLQVPGLKKPVDEAAVAKLLPPVLPKASLAPITGLRKRLQLGFKRRGGPAVTPTSPTVVDGPADAHAFNVPAQLPQSAPKPPRIFNKQLRPKAIRRSAPIRWQPLLFKLLIGLGVASGAVALQNQFPQFEIANIHSNLNSNRPAPEQAAHLNTARPFTPAQKAPQQLLLHRIVAHQSAVYGVSFADNGRLLVTAGADGTIKLWNTANNNHIKTLDTDKGPATALVTRGNLALTGHSEGDIVLWDLDEGVKQRTYKRNDARIWALAFAGSRNRFWSAGHDWAIALWDIQTPSTPLQVLEEHTNPVQAVSYSSETVRLASGGADKTVRLWNGASFEQVRIYRRMGDFVSALGFSRDGRNLVAGLLDGNIRLMKTTRSRSKRIKAHDGAIVGVKFYSDKRFVTAGKDGSIKTWSVNNARPLAHIVVGARRSLSAIDVSSDTRQIVVADASGSVTVWRIPE